MAARDGQENIIAKLRGVMMVVLSGRFQLANLFFSGLGCGFISYEFCTHLI